MAIRRGAAFDIQAVCSGFVFALPTADNFIRAGQVRTALVIGAETYSRILDWTDRGTCVLFGDGAGALVLRAANGVAGEAAAPVGNRARGILSTHLHSDGRFRDILYVDGGPSSTQTRGLFADVRQGSFPPRRRQPCRGRRRGGRRQRPDADATSIGWCRIRPTFASSTALRRKLGLPAERVIATVDRHANTSAASIPLALDVACGDGRLKAGDLVLMEAIGGGLTWGAALARW